MFPVFYWDEDVYVDEDVEGVAELGIGPLAEKMFLSALEIEDLPYINGTENQMAGDCMRVLAPLLKWLETIRPSAG